MSIRLLLVAALFLCAIPAVQAVEYTRVNTAASQISFTYNQMVRGCTARSPSSTRR